MRIRLDRDEEEELFTRGTNRVDTFFIGLDANGANFNF
jgi:hypothetical protein